MEAIFNVKVLLLTALVPMVLGFLWYGPIGFQKAWMTTAGVTDDDIKKGNMLLIFGLAFIFSFFLAMALNFIVIHQNGFISTLIGDPASQDPNSPLYAYMLDFMTKYGTNFRTFKHGALHGFMNSLFIVLPVLGTNAMFERKSFKYILINVGYWSLCMTIMGGIICQFS